MIGAGAGDPAGGRVGARSGGRRADRSGPGDWGPAADRDRNDEVVREELGVKGRSGPV
jgi:hypothetical protein